MNIEELRDYCLAKAGVEEGFPFGQEVLVFKVMNKIFLLTSLDSDPPRANLKMDSELVPEYRERYEAVIPGWHMNKKTWNTVYYNDSSIPKKELLWMIDHSYTEVAKTLPKKTQQELKELM
jgi:hypothetical protein